MTAGGRDTLGKKSAIQLVLLSNEYASNGQSTRIHFPVPQTVPAKRKWWAGSFLLKWMSMASLILAEAGSDSKL